MKGTHHATVSGRFGTDTVIQRRSERLDPIDSTSGTGMYGNLNNLQSVWRGGAATQFNAVAEQWRAAQQQMERSLESIQHALMQASSLYADTEMQASRLFAQ